MGIAALHPSYGLQPGRGRLSKARRTISLILASLLTLAGAVGAIWFVLLAPIYSFRLAGAAGLVLAVGVAWLYSDFIDATPNEERR
jgi:hypothetical protein